jgi:hypothetical protein
MSDFLFCPLRKTWVAALPEERIRQSLIQEMISNLGYPMGNIALEKSLSQLPHIQSKTSLPKRRADLIVFAKELHPHHLLYPLLLVECKATPLNDRVLRQMIGYNQFVGACFIAAVNSHHVYLGCYQADRKDFAFREGLLAYELLLQQASKTFD